MGVSSNGVVVLLFVIVVAVVLVIAAAAVLLNRRSSAGDGSEAGSSTDSDRVGPKVSDFHVSDGVAQVRFEVPLPSGDVDAVLADLLIREAVEVVREKRHTLPISDVHSVVALGRRGGEWIEVGRVALDTPGVLPPPMIPELLPHASRPGFDAFDRMSDLPENPPSLAHHSSTETLSPIGPELRLANTVEAGLRAQGLDPESTDACALVLGVMRLAGYTVVERSADTFEAMRAGQRIFLRTVGHGASDHPELAEPDIDRFVVGFMSSGSDRGLLITEKFSPFEVYDRERREPRMRFITRERMQAFVDALAMG